MDISTAIVMINMYMFSCDGSLLVLVMCWCIWMSAFLSKNSGEIWEFAESLWKKNHTILSWSLVRGQIKPVVNISLQSHMSLPETQSFYGFALAEIKTSFCYWWCGILILKNTGCWQKYMFWTNIYQKLGPWNHFI